MQYVLMANRLLAIFMYDSHSVLLGYENFYH
jgi:hypothetical protein